MKTTPSPRIEILNCCDTSRREFLKVAGAGLAVAAAAPLAGEAFAAKKKASMAEGRLCSPKKRPVHEGIVTDSNRQ